MKIALLTDTHWGVKKDSQLFHQNFKRFLDDIFFPYCQDNSIKTMVHLGDLVHDRRKIGALTLSAIRSDFLDKLRDLKIDSHFIVGNHDCYWTNSNKNNFQKEVVSLYKGFKIYEEAEEITLNKCKILMMPWINKENYQNSIDMIEKSKAHVLMGHLELAGFQMYRGIENKGGMSAEIFNKFHVTLSGHYHTKSSDKTIHYLGTMSQHTWADEPDIKGFHIFDTNDLSLTFVQNPYRMYEIVEYPSDKILDVKDKYVQIFVKSKDSEQDFEAFKTILEDQGPASIIVKDINLQVTVEENQTFDVKDNLTIIKQVIDSSDCQYPELVFETLKEVYLEAMNVKV